MITDEWIGIKSSPTDYNLMELEIGSEDDRHIQKQK